MPMVIDAIEGKCRTVLNESFLQQAVITGQHVGDIDTAATFVHCRHLSQVHLRPPFPSEAKLTVERLDTPFGDLTKQLLASNHLSAEE